MIRRARVADKARVVELLRDSREGAAFDRQDGPSGFVFPFDPEFAEAMFLRYLVGPCTLALVHTAGFDVPQGILLAHAYTHDFGPVRLSQERLWWIDPAHRGSTAAVRMLDAYEQWAFGEQRCEFVGMAGMGDDPKVAKLYEHRGYVRAETNYLLRRAA
jgi:hypothetical protein